ncbi:hypothetical protein Bca52824_078020 [Brassica carinata]|uniref:Uncharacterized protein n=1 Tax=Brassica carinata TaxID=52824 RepID=A0A8X7U0K3_BRACI|nr:hypothetical protein Bca52824_078020 [Brassica carinata]
MGLPFFASSVSLLGAVSGLARGGVGLHGGGVAVFLPLPRWSWRRLVKLRLGDFVGFVNHGCSLSVAACAGPASFWGLILGCLLTALAKSGAFVSVFWCSAVIWRVDFVTPENRGGGVDVRLSLGNRGGSGLDLASDLDIADGPPFLLPPLFLFSVRVSGLARLKAALVSLGGGVAVFLLLPRWSLASSCQAGQTVTLWGLSELPSVPSQMDLLRLLCSVAACAGPASFWGLILGCLLTALAKSGAVVCGGFDGFFPNKARPGLSRCRSVKLQDLMSSQAVLEEPDLKEMIIGHCRILPGSSLAITACSILWQAIVQISCIICL